MDMTGRAGAFGWMKRQPQGHRARLQSQLSFPEMLLVPAPLERAVLPLPGLLLPLAVSATVGGDTELGSQGTG